jgi:hypothetical protein
MPIEAYFARPSSEIAAIFDNVQTRYIASRSELAWAASLADGLGDTLPHDAPEDLGPNLAEAKRRLDRFAFVGLTERFPESAMLLAYTFDWQPVREVRVLNVTQRRILRDQLAPPTIARIREHNATDSALSRLGSGSVARHGRPVNRRPRVSGGTGRNGAAPRPGGRRGGIRSRTSPRTRCRATCGRRP